MATILVTGGAGFVGSSLAIGMRACTPDLRVIALDNLRRRGSELNLCRLRDGGVEFVHGDIRNPEDLEDINHIDLIVECSAEPSVLAGFQGSARYVVNTNLVGTANCLEEARRRGAGFIFLSTSRVYPTGAINALTFREEATRFVLDGPQSVPGVSDAGISEHFPLHGPRSLYGATKLCSEFLVQEYLGMYALKGVIDRCGVIAGPWQMGKVDQGVVVFWIARHVFGGELNYIGYEGTGKQVRDVLHIDDLLRLILYQIDHLDELNGETYNVGGGPECSVSLLELSALCREVTGSTVAIGADPEGRPADVPWYLSDCARLTERTGWRPEKDLPTIVRDVHQWIRDNEAALEPILGTQST